MDQDFTVFYSWQSDLPNSTNRGLIHDALQAAVERLGKDESITEPIRVDRDTSGVPGAPDIADTIFSKIDACQVFVGDVSIINPGAEDRLTPNPSVMLETGYALRALGAERHILVANTAFGRIEDLPFDIRPRRVIPYSMEKAAENRSKERNRLSGVLEAAIRTILERPGSQAPKLTPLEQLDRYAEFKEATESERWYEAEALLAGIEDYLDVPTQAAVVRAGRRVSGT